MMVSDEDKKKFIKGFKRRLKSVKSSNYYFSCDLCDKSITPKMLFVVDSRNDKYCTDCANVIFDAQISGLQSDKKKLINESMLNELEEEDNATIS